jgi:hypothetical protein
MGSQTTAERSHRHARYRDNPKLQAKDYLEKVVQLPFVMRGLSSAHAQKLMEPYEEASGWVGDSVMRALVFAGTAANPRRIKRFINTYYVLSRVAEIVDNIRPSLGDAHRLALILLLQMRAPAVYSELARNPRLLEDYRETFNLALQQRDERLARRADLRLIFDDPALRAFLEYAKQVDVSASSLEKWVLLARGDIRITQRDHSGEKVLGAVVGH